MQSKAKQFKALMCIIINYNYNENRNHTRPESIHLSTVQYAGMNFCFSRGLTLDLNTLHSRTTKGIFTVEAVPFHATVVQLLHNT